MADPERPFNSDETNETHFAIDGSPGKPVSVMGLNCISARRYSVLKKEKGVIPKPKPPPVPPLEPPLVYVEMHGD